MFSNRRGNLVEKGVTLVLFIFIMMFVAGIGGQILFEYNKSLNDSYGDGSKPQVIGDYGLNSTYNFAAQIPAAATIGGIVIVIVMVAWAVGGFLKGRNDGSPPQQGFDGSGGFGPGGL